MIIDQSFAASNFRKIIDRERRKGRNLEEEFFKDLEDVIEEIKKCVSEIRAIKANRARMSAKDFNEKKTALYEKRSELKKEKKRPWEGRLRKLARI